MQKDHHSGFTLIELSIVLVIIGLIVGGILVGRDLIASAAIRAQVGQIEKYQTAVNVFRTKYNALPGDLSANIATQVGFIARGTLPGQGDGNGVIEGTNGGPVSFGSYFSAGETAVFWVDLSQANLIPQSFTLASSTVVPSAAITGTAISSYMPESKLAKNYILVWSGGLGGTDSTNYFELEGINQIDGGGEINQKLALSEQQAYDIDRKIDDGGPQSGSVRAMMLDDYDPFTWANDGAPPGSSITAAATTCYDNGGSATAAMRYTTSINSGTGLNCSLSFRFQ